jgi:type II secretory ATPase GspE/PulE/Tfp pilus assembly ATPase PilB-like protein
MAEWRYYPDIYLEGLRKATNISARIGGVLTEIRTENLPITSRLTCSVKE